MWDFVANSNEAFADLFARYQLDNIAKSPAMLHDSYMRHNEALWDLYRKGKVNKAFLRVERFRLMLSDFGAANEALAQELSVAYLEIAPQKTNLVEGCIETLDYLKTNYHLHIITNGFSEVQDVKLNKSGLLPYFNKVITSDGAGVQKPKPGIFHMALASANAQKNQSIMIGDDLKVDIIGAKRYGMHQVFFEPCQTKASGEGYL
ncbi:MAG: noncanonical pyrimidine nucleotidase, YjjG family [Bacteroidales bacterium]|nr:noncanonical pyrimidine nucleotidase, YjjG family [Bacteroidales bacterium]